MPTGKAVLFVWHISTAKKFKVLHIIKVIKQASKYYIAVANSREATTADCSS